MSFDELQTAWQHQRAALPKTEVNHDMLRDVQSQSRTFRRSVFWRDVREVLASLLVAAVFGNIGWQAAREGAVSWPAYVAAATALGVGVFFLVDRGVMRRRAAPQGDTLRAELKRAINEVEHQIWLLRNVAWWYLAPLALGPILMAVQITVYGPKAFPWWAEVLIWTLLIGTTWWFDKWIWRLNQNAVRDQLQPRRDKLRAQLREFETVE
ncbi:MAG: hypothetical protein SynsKO_03700 [Synoicihabitans sp.]